MFPARHFASSLTDPDLPAMGQRLRLKRCVRLDASHARRGSSRTALQRYGMLVADNGSDWFISGAPDPRWDNDDLRALKRPAGQRLRGRHGIVSRRLSWPTNFASRRARVSGRLASWRRYRIA